MREFHPVSGIVPLLDGPEFDALMADIQERGVIEPIFIHPDDGRIVDGRNRARACDRLGIPCPERPWDGRGSLVGFVLSLNVKRRHLDKTMCAFAALAALPMFDEEARVRQEATRAKPGERADERSASAPVRSRSASVPEQDPPAPAAVGKATAQAAAAAGVSPRYVEDAKWLENEAPDLAAKCKAGETKLALAKREAKARKRAAADAARQEALPTRAEVRRMDALDFLRSLAPGSADLLLTDPLYSTDSPDVAAFAAEWVPLALSRLKPTGRAYIFTGAYPAELHGYLSILLGDTAGFTLANVLVWTYRNTIGPASKLDYNQNWQACFYLRGPDAPPLDCPSLNEQFAVQEVSAPDGRQGTRLHRWQKPDDLADRLIRHSTRPGDLVIDPFAGTGTFLLRAAVAGRRARGCDIDDDMIAIATRRGCALAG